jgi:ribosome biogenesis GTPase / thiamine phosphate phosphatase
MAPPPDMPDIPDMPDGEVRARVIAAHGRLFYLRLADGSDRSAVTRGKRTDVVAGDEVMLQDLGSGQAVIERVIERVNVLRRSDVRREQALAANLDQAAITLSGEPPFSEELLVRVLIAAEREGIDCLLIATKCDIPSALSVMAPRLALYESLGYRVVRVASKADPQGTVDALRPLLRGRRTLLLGQSGMGKSTLVNLLVPGAEMATQAISEVLQAGRHTTTFTRAFELPGGDGWLIDSPGFQLFGLAHLSASEIEHGMREFKPLLGQCRFNNCTHLHEPGCAIRGAVDAGRIDARRHALYAQLRPA